MKIVINKCYGGFGISKEAAEFMAERGNKRAIQELKECSDKFYGMGYVAIPIDDDGGSEYSRTDPDLIAAVEILGDKACGFCAKLKVVEIPDSIQYEISDYDGMESIREIHP